MSHYKRVALLALVVLPVLGQNGCPTPPNAIHTLTVSVSPVGRGTVIVTPDQVGYVVGTEVQLEAVPDEGWEFSSWTGVGFNTALPVTRLAIYGDTAVTANFREKEEDRDNIIADPGFEQGIQDSAWSQSSDNYDFVVCDDQNCGVINGIGPHAGTFWAQFSNPADGSEETAAIEQNVDMPTGGSATLQFHVVIPAAEVPGALRVFMERNMLFEITEADALTYADYELVSLDVSSYADGDTYTLRFEYHNDETSGGTVAFFVDDVCLVSGGAYQGQALCANDL